MKLFLIKPRGFCAGVVRAIDTVEKAIKMFGTPIYVKHEIVHNRHVVNDLKEKGAIFVEELKDIPENSRVIYSAHGVSPQVRDEAKKRNLIEIDATCGLVTKIHSAVKRYAKKGYKIILIGKKKHVEVIGTYQEAPDSTTIVEKLSDVKNLTFSKLDKISYVTQTTLSIDDVKEITNEIVKKYPWIETLPSSSICYATTNRQMALKDIVDEVDLVFVIGDPTSSNSNRLKEVASKKSKPSFLINSEDEIDPNCLKGISTIAMSAGASTPENIVQRCIDRLKQLGVNEVDERVYKKEDVVFQLPEAVLS